MHPAPMNATGPPGTLPEVMHLPEKILRPSLAGGSPEHPDTRCACSSPSAKKVSHYFSFGKDYRSPDKSVRGVYPEEIPQH